MSGKKSKVLKVIGWLFVAVLVIALALPLWIGPVVTGVANSVVPGVTGTGFNLGEFGLNPYAGTVRLGDMQLQNPERFFTSGREEAKEGESVLGAAARVAGNAVAAVGDAVTSSETNAVSFSSVEVNVAMTSLLSDALRIEDVTIRDLSIYGDLTFSNIREIVAAASGEEKEGDEKKKDEEASGKEDEAEESGKRVEIDHVLITGTKFQWGHVSVPLPDIELKDIGKKEPVDEDGACDTILNAICDAADKAQAGLGTALKAAIKGGKAVGKAVGDVAGAIGDGVSAAADAGKGALDAASDAAGAATDAIKGIFK